MEFELKSNEIVVTTTESINNFLQEAGDYAGEYSDEAYKLLECELDEGEMKFDANQWCDIMKNKNTGKLYAVYAEDALTSCSSAIMIEVQRVLSCNIDLTELFLQAERCGFDGWFKPIWAKIDEDEAEITLSLGDAVSQNTTFRNDENETPASWVGKINCWERYWKEGDAELWAEECHDYPENFDCDEECRNQVENFDFDDFRKELKQKIVEYAKSEGYIGVNFN